MPETEKLSAREVYRIWQNKIAGKPKGYPFWLYLHIPYCPQNCKYCQCSRQKLDDQHVPAEYLNYLEEELKYFAPLFKNCRVHSQYIGGGSPNLLSSDQMAHLFELLDSRFSYEPDVCKTFEFLASIFKEEMLGLLRGHGFTRLSCGVQSQTLKTLKLEERSATNMDNLASIVDKAFTLGFDDFNLDLMWGLHGESDATFIDSLIKTLSLNPTTVSIHMTIPTETNQLFTELSMEISATENFLKLHQNSAKQIASAFPHYQWIYRPNIWILVRKDFAESGRFSLDYYSDNERIHYDMLALGRYAFSHIIGEANISNTVQQLEFDADAKSYDCYKLNNSLEAATDLVTELSCNSVADMKEIENRYPGESLVALGSEIKKLEQQKVLEIEGATCRYTENNDPAFINELWPLIENTMVKKEVSIRSDKSDFADALPNFVKISDGYENIMVMLERKLAGRVYYAEIGAFGLMYANEPHLSDEDYNRILTPVLPVVEKLIEQNPTISAGDIMSELADKVPPVD